MQPGPPPPPDVQPPAPPNAGAPAHQSFQLSKAPGRLTTGGLVGILVSVVLILGGLGFFGIGPMAETVCEIRGQVWLEEGEALLISFGEQREGCYQQ